MIDETTTGEETGQNQPAASTEATANAPAPAETSAPKAETAQEEAAPAVAAPPEGAAKSELPAEVEPSLPETFEDMRLRPEVLQALIDMGWSRPTDVQKHTYWKTLAGKDLMVQARTGSGKTGAFGVPFAQHLIDASRGEVQVMALCPTRELALQVANECEKIGARSGVKVAAVYGGAPMGKQIEALKGGAQIVAGTPGRVLDHLRRGTLVLDKLRALVLDECDEMLSMGFYEEISEILKRCPTNRQTLLFSATIPDDIERIAQKYMRQPEKIELSGGRIDVSQITHGYYMVSGMGRSRDLVAVLHIEKPESAIIFCNTREETSHVAEYLRRSGLDAEAISSDLTQKDRERVMGRMRAQNLHYLVATDIAARGIDISDLSHVINYTFPDSPEVYVHRTGRTGRAGKTGIALSLISPRELGNFYYLKLTYKIKPEERQLPSPEEEATRLDGERMAQIAKSIGSETPNEEWRRLARRVWSSEGGEAMVAALIEQWFDRARRGGEAAPSTEAAVEAVIAEEAPSAEGTTEESAGAPRERGGRDRRRRDDRGGRGERGGRSGAGQAEGGRDRRSREDRGARAERPARGASRAASSTDEARTAESAPADAVAKSPETEAPASAKAEPGATPAESQKSEAERNAEREERRKRHREERDRRRDEREKRREDRKSDRQKDRPAARKSGQSGQGSDKAAAPKASPLKAPTLETRDGLEFWEVWADEQVEPGQPTAGQSNAGQSNAGQSNAGQSNDWSPARSERPAEASNGSSDSDGNGASEDREPAEPGTVRLYFNLGRRDRMRPEEVERFISERGAAFRRLHVRNTHTYITVAEEQADAVIAALNGIEHGTRTLMCERSRR